MFQGAILGHHRTTMANTPIMGLSPLGTDKEDILCTKALVF